MLPTRRPSSPWTVSPLLLTLLCLLVLPSAARAGGTFVPRLALHLLPVTSKNACGRAEAMPACNAIVTRGALYPAAYYAYLLVTNGDPGAGLAGVECGLDYNGAPHQGVDIFGWVNCADLNFPQTGWPAAGTGNLITWDPTVRCQRQEPGGPGTGVVATAGYFYLAAYSPDALKIVPRPVSALAAAANCSPAVIRLDGDGEHHDPSLLGTAAFSAGAASAGYNPCADAPAPIPCLISGPWSIDEGSTASYTAAEAPPGASFAWSISGHATITGSTSDATVSVLAGSHGDFDLSVVINHAGVLSECREGFRVDAPTSECRVYGPTEVTEGEIGVSYSAYGSNPTDAILWEITGDGTLTSDPTQHTVSVNAGNSGVFELTVHDTPAGQPTQVCRKTVTITPFVCGIQGDDPAPAHFTGYPYYAGPELQGATYDWQISGDASISGSHQNRIVRISTNGPGTFDLVLTMSRGGRTEHCARTISVTENASTTGPNAATKLLIHLLPVATRETCGAAARPRCTTAVTAGGLFPTFYYAYLIAGDADAGVGLGALQCGIDYDGAAHTGVDVFNWTPCAPIEAHHSGPNGPWPAPGSGNSIIWDTTTSCQRSEPGGAGTGVVATAGYFYMAAYGPDQLRVIPSPPHGQAVVLDCGARQYLIGGAGFPPNGTSHLGFANFSADGLSPGFNPCGANVAVRVTTWSAIKGLYSVPAKPGKP